MLKLLFILLLIGLIASYLIKGVKKKINNMFSPFKPQNPNDRQEKQDEVIYSKDDVVVLKGDAKKNDNQQE